MKVSGIRAVSNVGEMNMGMVDPDAMMRIWLAALRPGR
jgi:hypothetical protein